MWCVTVRHWARYNASLQQLPRATRRKIKMKCNADDPNMWLSLTQCPSQVVVKCWLHPSAISWSALHSFLKASMATFLKASKAFGSLMAFLSYPSLPPFFSEVSWPCLSHAVKTNITWVKILKSCSQYKVSESLSITFTTFKKITSKTQPGKNIFHKLILSLHRAPLKVEPSRLSLQKPCRPHNSFHFNPDITKYVRYVETGPPHLFNH